MMEGWRGEVRNLQGMGLGVRCAHASLVLRMHSAKNRFTIFLWCARRDSNL